MPIIEQREHPNTFLSVQGFSPPRGKTNRVAAWLRFESPMTAQEATEAAKRILDFDAFKTGHKAEEKDVARVAQKLLILGAFASLYDDKGYKQPSPLLWLDCQSESTLDQALERLAAWQPALALEAFAPSKEDLEAHRQAREKAEHAGRFAWEQMEKERKRANEAEALVRRYKQRFGNL